MNKKTILMLCVIIGAAMNQSCKKENTAMTSGNDNPLIAEWNTPFEVPPFDQIETKHFKPAIIEGIKEHENEIKSIVDSKENPTFENVIVAINNAGSTLNKVTTV